MSEGVGVLFDPNGVVAELNVGLPELFELVDESFEMLFSLFSIMLSDKTATPTTPLQSEVILIEVDSDVDSNSI
jgi:hypothetical protein